MKTKIINTIIQNKFNAWLRTIKDEKVQALVKDNTIMTGGAIASMLLNEDVNDFDFYFRNLETTKAVAQYYVSQFLQTKNEKDNESVLSDESSNTVKVPIEVVESEGRVKIVAKSAGISAEEDVAPYRYFELDQVPNSDPGGDYVKRLLEIRDELKSNHNSPEYKPVFLSSNAITLSNDIQVVIRFYGEPAEIHENYDYAHCMNYWTSWENKVTLNPKALECLLTRELIYVGSKYPLASICRMRKFIERGWHITAGQILKIVFQLGELNLKDFSTLEDHLTGVDMAYFFEILAKMKEKDPTSVDSGYLSTLIDEMF
jgi:hypothetical protein